MPRRRGRTTTSTPSEGASASSDSIVPAPPPGIDQFSKGALHDAGSGAPAGGATPGAKGKQEEDKQRQPALFHKTKICKFNQLGLCTRGELCRFAHGKLDMNPLPDLSRTKLCKDLINTGQCNQPNCKFAHNKHELRRHPFVPNSNNSNNHNLSNGEHSGQQAGSKAAAQLQQLPATVAYETGLGQQVAQLQANASLLCSDLANILSRMRENEFMQAHMQQNQANASMLYSDLACVLKGVSEKDLVDAWMQQSQMNAGLISDFGGALCGFDEKGLVAAWGQADQEESLLTAGYLNQTGQNGYPGGADPAEMDQLASTAIWGQDSYYESLLEDRSGLLPSKADEALQQKPKPKLLSPMYAPSVSLANPPPFALA